MLNLSKLLLFPSIAVLFRLFPRTFISRNAKINIAMCISSIAIYRGSPAYITQECGRRVKMNTGTYGGIVMPTAELLNLKVPSCYN